MRIVVIGSCRFAPYQITAPVTISVADQRQAEAYRLRRLGKQKQSQKLAAPVFHSDIDACDEVWLYAPDGIGEHTQQDLDYAKSKGKLIRIVANEKDGCRRTNQMKAQELRKIIHLAVEHPELFDFISNANDEIDKPDIKKVSTH